MRDNGDLDGGEILIAKSSLLCFRPREAEFVDFEHVLEEHDFLWPEKVTRVEGKLIEALLREACARDEGGRVYREWGKRKQGVDRDPPSVAEIFGQRRWDWLDLLGDLFVHQCEGSRCGGREWWGKAVLEGQVERQD